MAFVHGRHFYTKYFSLFTRIYHKLFVITVVYANNPHETFEPLYLVYRYVKIYFWQGGQMVLVAASTEKTSYRHRALARGLENMYTVTNIKILNTALNRGLMSHTNGKVCVYKCVHLMVLKTRFNNTVLCTKTSEVCDWACGAKTNEQYIHIIKNTASRKK